MTKRRSRKEKSKNSTEAENGIDSQEPKTDDEASLSEPSEPKKKKSEKRKSSKKSKKEEASKKDEKEEESESNDEDDEDAQYEVEEIIDEKMVRGVRHYLIRWKGYDEDGDTWEPEHTVDCPDLVKKFKEQKSDDENETPKKGRKSKGGDDYSPTKSKKENKASKKTKTHKKDEKSPKKSKTKTVPEVDWESDDEFEVDRILDVYFKKNGKREFLVSWKGYPSSQDSWEPEENLDCVDLIEKFMSKVEQAKLVEQKELRLNRTPTERFTLDMYSGDANRRLSRRLGRKQRVQYHDAE